MVNGYAGRVRKDVREDQKEIVLQSMLVREVLGVGGRLGHSCAASPRPAEALRTDMSATIPERRHEIALELQVE